MRQLFPSALPALRRLQNFRKTISTLMTYVEPPTEMMIQLCLNNARMQGRPTPHGGVLALEHLFGSIRITINELTW